MIRAMAASWAPIGDYHEMTGMGRITLRLIGIFLLLEPAAGCGGNTGDPLPTLYLVKGKVLKNGRPVSGGSIRFHAEKSQEAMIISGDVGDDGRFALTTKSGSRTAAGAPPGKYQVVYSPRITKQEFQPTILKALVTVESRDNVLTIDLDLKK
jgi:hypothetical protein